MSTLLFRGSAPAAQPTKPAQPTEVSVLQEIPPFRPPSQPSTEQVKKTDYWDLLKEARQLSKERMDELLQGRHGLKFVLLKKYVRRMKMAKLLGRVVVCLALASVAGGILFVNEVNKKRWVVQIRINGNPPTHLYVAPYGSKWGHNNQQGVFTHNDVSYTVRRDVDVTDKRLVGFTIYKTDDDTAVTQIKNVKNNKTFMHLDENNIRGVTEIKIERVKAKATKSQGEKDTVSLISQVSPLLILGAIGVAIVLNGTAAAIFYAKRREYRSGYTQFERDEAKTLLEHMRNATGSRRENAAKA